MSLIIPAWQFGIESSVPHDPPQTHFSQLQDPLHSVQRILGKYKFFA